CRERARTLVRYRWLRAPATSVACSPRPFRRGLLLVGQATEYHRRRRARPRLGVSGGCVGPTPLRPVSACVGGGWQNPPLGTAPPCAGPRPQNRAPPPRTR